MNIPGEKSTKRHSRIKVNKNTFQVKSQKRLSWILQSDFWGVSWYVGWQIQDTPKNLIDEFRTPPKIWWQILSPPKTRNCILGSFSGPLLFPNFFYVPQENSTIIFFCDTLHLRFSFYKCFRFSNWGSVQPLSDEPHLIPAKDTRKVSLKATGSAFIGFLILYL